MGSETIAVAGMACNGCEQAVEEELNNVDGVTHAEADHEADRVHVSTDADVDPEELHAAIQRAGYDFPA